MSSFCRTRVNYLGSGNFWRLQSADDLNKQFGPLSGPKLFDTDSVPTRNFFKRLIFEKVSR